MSQNPNHKTVNEPKSSLTEAQIIKFALGEKSALDNCSINKDIINDAADGFELWQTDEAKLKTANTTLLQSLNSIVLNHKGKKKRRVIPKLNLIAIIAAVFIVLIIIVVWLFMQHTHSIKL